MKRYEYAKSKGLNWQVVLISDLETDLKTITRDCVLSALPYSSVNKKVSDRIKETISELESEELKKKVKEVYPAFASKAYLKWLLLYGTFALGVSVMPEIKRKTGQIPQKIKDSLKSLPKINYIAEAVKRGDLEKERAIADTTNDENKIDVPNGAYNRATPNMTYDKEYEKQVNDIADMKAKEDYSERWGMRASAERQLRQEWQDKQLSDMKGRGVDLVWIDSHANCSERCQPWQGKLYSISGKNGEIDGVRYQPLTNARDIYDTTKAGKRYINGCTSGFNCRHKLVEYKQGFRPQPIPKEVIDKQRQLEETQRKYERTVRLYEERAIMYPKGSLLQKHYKGLSMKWEEEYKSFSKKNNIPFYPLRLDI